MTGNNIYLFFLCFTVVCALIVAVDWLCALFLRWADIDRRRIRDYDLNAHRITIDIRRAKL